MGVKTAPPALGGTGGGDVNKGGARGIGACQHREIKRGKNRRGFGKNCEPRHAFKGRAKQQVSQSSHKKEERDLGKGYSGNSSKQVTTNSSNFRIPQPKNRPKKK